MGGGLMRLVGYFAQGVYLTGNPQITFFKVVYRRHTNFSMELIQQTINGSVASGGRNTVTISRNGDLVTKMYWKYDLNGSGNSLNPGHALIGNVTLEIGGQKIDKHTGHFMEVHAQLTEPNPAAIMLDSIAANTGTKFQNMAKAGGCVNASAEDALNIWVPLRFWFNKNPGLALPLIALQYHEVRLITEFTSPAHIDAIGNVEFWTEYIYLDTDERRRFAQVSHEYLIEQLQEQASTGASRELNFNHPVKELIWTGAYAETTGVLTDISHTTYQLKLNGHDRFAAQPLNYFTQVQVWEYHTGTPTKLDSAGLTPGTAAGNASVKGIAVYSFALKPEEHQPSGTCNFSRIDNAQLVSTGGTASDTINVFAINYNVLRIMSGMGGLAYSN